MSSLHMNNLTTGGNCFKEAVCINAGRIYDSCSDRDCLENLLVYFTDATQPIVDQSINIKCKDVEIKDIYLNVEEVPFNKGFYSVDITFFFEVKLNAYMTPIAPPTPITGLSTFQKKVILYGSEGNVKIYTSETNGANDTSGLPVASIHSVKPICLAAKLVECLQPRCESIIPIPEKICCCYDGCFCCIPSVKQVFVTIGLFTIVQLERTVQIMIPAYDFCVPDKCGDCGTSSDDPCELFKKIKFPVNAFFPPRLNEEVDDCQTGL